MRISREQAQENHDRVVTTAAKLFRERGFDGVAVGDLMKAAGFTHGVSTTTSSPRTSSRGGPGPGLPPDGRAAARVESLDELLTQYLSDAARRAPGRACPAAALAGDASRQGAGEAGLRAGLRADGGLDGGPPARGPQARGEAIALLSRMVGALALARAMPEDSDLGREVLAAALAGCRKDVARA
uniref:TetR family transcriptional regulator n=1 Tax=Phenylobacterium glaciei TaxID=2803784 RepID=A0A974S7Z1_9CAUL|nr:TetR family transcriptional regulator [Phenylobacterium glaciei]